MPQSRRNPAEAYQSRSAQLDATIVDASSKADVRIVSIRDVRLHERFDPRRVKPLKEDLLTSGILRDPPIAAIHDGRAIILDGATRTTALREIGASRIPVQVVQYAHPQVILDCWYHNVQGVSADRLDEAIQIATGVSGVQQDISVLQHALAAGKGSFALLSGEGYGYIYHLNPKTETLSKMLNQVFDIYGKRFKVIRMTPSEVKAQPSSTLGHACIVAYPRFSPAEVLAMGGNGCKLPAGITRHTVQGRVTNLMVPLKLLIDPDEAAGNRMHFLDASVNHPDKDKGVGHLAH